MVQTQSTGSIGRPSLRHAGLPVLVRTYAQGAGPNQQQVLESFGTPFLMFFRTLSRIARIVVLSGVSVATAVALIFEGTHQYVEHVGMPRSQMRGSFLERGDVKADASAKNEEEDAWGWAHELGDESWTGGNLSGTDPRLGWRGRHMVRAAWINAHWGGGILAESIFKSSSHGPIITSSQKNASFHEEDGLETAISYLASALRLAEEKGIRLPDMAAIRAGIDTPNTKSVRAHDNALDETAIAMEMKLASMRERLGTPTALRGAISGYARLYDALASLDATNRAMKSVGRSTGQPGVRADRLVRLAMRVGNAHASLGNHAEAELWLLRAVDAAGAGAVEEAGSGDPSRAGVFRNAILGGMGSGENDGSLRAAPQAEVREAKGTLAASQRAGDDRDILPAESLSSPSDSAPSPALTRSLIATLLGLSALYAQPQDRSLLEKALQFQASALRLTRVEMGRLALSDKGTGSGGGGNSEGSGGGDGPSTALDAQLHSMWLAQHDGLACVHVAETMYALGGNTASRASSMVRSMMSAIGLGRTAQHDDNSGSGKQHAITSSTATQQALAWLGEANMRAAVVTMQLGKTKGRRPSDKAELVSRWQQAPLFLSVPATRLLRDAIRLRAATDDMQSILAGQAQGQEQGKDKGSIGSSGAPSPA